MGNVNTVKWQRLSLQLPPSRLRAFRQGNGALPDALSVDTIWFRSNLPKISKVS